MQSPTLLVLAAGLGSRYGGIKQMDPVGPSGEFVLDYSVYDAWRAGFRRVVFIIREELEAPLREHFAGHLDGRMEVAYVVQHLDDLPDGFTVPVEREKPWGTGQAIWSAREVVDEPFAVINADDFYGAGAYQAVGAFLQASDPRDTTYAMVAYRLANTLSRHGSVSRGICSMDDDGYLADVVERTKIEKTDSGARFKRDDGSWGSLSGDELASLNLWGLKPRIFAQLGALFAEFLSEKRTEPKAEFYIPTVIDTLIKRGECRTRVLETDEQWFGMTYREDRDMVVERIAEMTERGLYPDPLWQRQ